MRALGITALAISDDHPNCNVLVTVPGTDAYTSFGDAQIAARDALPENDIIERLPTIGHAYRSSAW
ncbi:hypothetical protein [Roseiflexus sp.]|uniref:hypothetical protein n=1 Tax=Roseiflexus sp. TaxID=2562120 RepID=UPI0025903A2A|nr:hypothetical protein [Roseiflexus sp.]